MATTTKSRAPIDPDAERFLESMEVGWEEDHDGAGYDLTALAEASPSGRGRIEQILLQRPDPGWRDVEALDALGTPKARLRIRQIIEEGDLSQRIAVITHAPSIPTEAQRTAILCEALESAPFYGGLTQALDLVEDYSPQPVRDALFRGALRREGEVAVNFAAMLLFVHGQAESSFDWNERPFLLRFGEPKEREAAFDELCQRLGVDPAVYRAS